tara:strand:+ start:133 stop:807 length:675 start_codon:yes stop_codon:yes gene_type:complete
MYFNLNKLTSSYSNAFIFSFVTFCFLDTLYFFSESGFIIYLSSIIYLFLVLLCIYSYLKIDFSTLDALEKTFFLSPPFVAFLLNSYQDWYGDNYFQQISYWRDYDFAYFLVLFSEFIFVSLLFGAFNLFWINRYRYFTNSYKENTDNLFEIESKWKRYNLVARVFFSLSFNFGILTFTYNFFGFLETQSGSMLSLLFYFIISSAIYLTYDWFSEVLRLLSIKKN